jgi:hypothetical protein
MTQRLLRSTIYQKENLPTRARITRSWDGAAMTPSDCSSWGLKVYDVDSASPSDPVYVVTGGAPSDVLNAYGAAYSDWDEDSTGYNFQHVLDENDWARKGGHAYRCEYSLSSISDGPIAIPHLATMAPYWSV